MLCVYCRKIRQTIKPSNHQTIKPSQNREECDQKRTHTHVCGFCSEATTKNVVAVMSWRSRRSGATSTKEQADDNEETQNLPHAVCPPHTSEQTGVILSGASNHSVPQKVPNEGNKEDDDNECDEHGSNCPSGHARDGSASGNEIFTRRTRAVDKGVDSLWNHSGRLKGGDAQKAVFACA